jgi:hypothetical protein
VLEVRVYGWVMAQASQSSCMKHSSLQTVTSGGPALRVALPPGEALSEKPAVSRFKVGRDIHG